MYPSQLAASRENAIPLDLCLQLLFRTSFRPERSHTHSPVPIITLLNHCLFIVGVTMCDVLCRNVTSRGGADQHVDHSIQQVTLLLCLSARLFYRSVLFLVVVFISRCATATKDPQTFHRASHGEFYQTPPQLYNTFIEDPFLRECLSQRLPADVKQDVFSDLTRLGARVSSELDPLGAKLRRTHHSYSSMTHGGGGWINSSPHRHGRECTMCLLRRGLWVWLMRGGTPSGSQ